MLTHNRERLHTLFAKKNESFCAFHFISKRYYCEKHLSRRDDIHLRREDSPSDKQMCETHFVRRCSTKLTVVQLNRVVSRCLDRILFVVLVDFKSRFHVDADKPFWFAAR